MSSLSDARFLSIVEISELLSQKSSASCKCNCFGFIISKSPLMKTIFLIECVGITEKESISCILLITHPNKEITKKWHDLIKVPSIFQFTNMTNTIFTYVNENNQQKKNYILSSTSQSELKNLKISEFFFYSKLKAKKQKKQNFHSQFLQLKYENNKQNCFKSKIKGIIDKYLGHGIFLLKQNFPEQKEIPIFFSYYKLEKEERRNFKVPQFVTIKNIHEISFIYNPVLKSILPSILKDYNSCFVCCSLSNIKFENNFIDLMNDSEIISLSQSILSRSIESIPFFNACWFLYQYEQICEYFTFIFDQLLKPEISLRMQFGKPSLLTAEDFQQRIHENFEKHSVHEIELDIVKQYYSFIFPMYCRDIYNEFINHNVNCITELNFYDNLKLHALGPSIFTNFEELIPTMFLELMEQNYFPSNYFLF